MNDVTLFRRARFARSAQTLEQCPEDSGVEVAFAGRSNAGKSSAINTLTHNGKLARTSKTPGRTQLINFFTLDDDRRLVDLPGYGFAKVPKAMKQEWDHNLAAYLQQRQSLKGLILLMDIRHPMQDYDRQIIHWARQAALPVHLLLTKADKLKSGPAKAVLMQVEKQLERDGLAENTSIQLFSAPKRTGLEALEALLTNWYT